MNIWVNGCFDILHVGHLKLFDFAKNLQNRRNRLIVGIDSDKRVKELVADLEKAGAKYIQIEITATKAGSNFEFLKATATGKVQTRGALAGSQRV